MATSNGRFLALLKKWPLKKDVSQCYGRYLRSVLEKSSTPTAVLSNNPVEDTKMMDSLHRLADNKYKKKYSHSKGGSTDLTLEQLNVIMTDKFLEEIQKKIII